MADINVFRFYGRPKETKLVEVKKQLYTIVIESWNSPNECRANPD